MQIGAFKTAHPGKVVLENSFDLPPFTNHTVCVKQTYERQAETRTISRRKGRHELSALSKECTCLNWASILLDMTYQYIARESKRYGRLNYYVPELRFARTMIAIVQEGSMEKVFLIEEWIDTDPDTDTVFTKYINNRSAKICLEGLPSLEAQVITDFLSFAQHVQWVKSKNLTFTSDYQGAGNLLTDPQIIADPCALSSLFKFGLTDHPQQKSWPHLWRRKSTFGFPCLS
jgi:hypothetical protein